jgi:hypothetical protein
MKKAKLIGKKAMMLFLAMGLLIGSLPYCSTEAATGEKGYLMLVQEKDGSWSEYGNCIEILPKDILMVNASEAAVNIGINFKKKDSKTFTISNGKKRNTYTKDSATYQYDNGKKTVAKKTGYKSYVSADNKANMIEYSTLENLIYVKLFNKEKAGDYQAAGYAGVLCLSKYHKITKLPEMEAGIRVSTEAELIQAAADSKISNIIITEDITVKGDFTCEREENPVNLHIQKGKTLTIHKEYIEVGGTLTNDGRIVVKGSLVRGICNLINNGVIVIESGGSAGSGMSDLNNNGSLKIVKGANLTIDRGSAFYNYGELLNEGSIKVDDGGSLSDKGGKIINSGVIDLYSYYNGDVKLITGAGTVNDYRETAK